jgi:sulfite reductase (NADPH) flavoprotein alpha-component
MEVKIIYGSETGNSETLANDAKKSLSASGIDAQVLYMQDVKLSDIKEYKNLILITSTWGDGEPPSNAMDLHEELTSASGADLAGLNYAVFAIGQSFYDQFCKAGKDFDSSLAALGATRLAEITLSDDDFDDTFPEWIAKVKDLLLKQS